MPFVLAEPWLSQIHPRRGGAGVRAVEPDPRARAVFDGMLQAYPAFVPAVIASEFTDPELADAARAWQAGDPAATPAGAATLAFAAQLADWQATVNHPWFADLWLTERGVRFAAEAAVELLAMMFVSEGDRALRRAIRRDGTDVLGVRRRRDGEHRTVSPHWDPELITLLRVRAVLATVSDEVHAETVAALAPYRELGPYQRCATSLLVPSEAGWVAQDWAEALAEPDFHRAAILLAAIGTPEQAASARASGSLISGWRGLSATLVDGVGPAAATGLLLDWLDRIAPAHTAGRRDLVSLLATLPEDGAMSGLLDRLTHRHVRAALLEAAARFPERALRLFAVAATATPVRAGSAAAATPVGAGSVVGAAPVGAGSVVGAAPVGAGSAAAATPVGAGSAVAATPVRTRPAAVAGSVGSVSAGGAAGSVRPASSVAGRAGVGDLLRVRVRADPARAERVAAELGGAPAARIREVLSDLAAMVPAQPHDLPPLLADPPWRRRRKAQPPVVLRLTPTEVPETVEWVPGERDEWLAASFHPVGAGDWARAADRLRRGEPKGWREPVEFFAGAPEELAAPLLAGWQPATTWQVSLWGRRIAARFGVAALPPLLRLATRAPAEVAGLLLPFAAPQIAPLMAEWLLRLKRSRPAALAWLDRHPTVAAQILIPRALGPAGTARRQAENALFALAAGGHTEALSAAAKAYGPEAAAAVESLAATDPLDILPARMPVLPGWAAPELLPPVRLRAGAADPELPPSVRLQAPSARPGAASTGDGWLVLPAEALRDLAMVFALGRPGEPYPGVEIVREACEPADLAQFVRGLFEGWQADGAEGKHGWVLDALGLVGDDETVRMLTPRILAWPGEAGHARAVAGVRVLAEIGTDVALTHLNGVAERSKFKGLKAAAREKIAEVADTRGLTTEQLADRLVPDFGLAPDGTLTLDYGPRRFVVGFDEELKPFAVDTAGKRLKTLPRPGARDDAEQATAAYQRFAALKKDVRAVAADQIRRLERAMLSARRWPPEEFRRYLVEHPLLRHLTRRLLWGRYDPAGALLGAVRLAEDGTFADVHDEVATIADGDLVGVVHPLHLGDALPQWAEVFADYGILQPFPQLGRETPSLTAAEAAGRVLTRFRGRTVPSGAVLGLESRGWRRETPQDGGVQSAVTVSPGDGVEFSLGLEPGIVVGAPDVFPEQTLGTVSFHGGARTFGELDPVAVSELLRDLERLVITF